tara:strand:+ start:353 stop:682 length:330 start_codon:yes stop_codon:yes gene_type:complete
VGVSLHKKGGYSELPDAVRDVQAEAGFSSPKAVLEFKKITANKQQTMFVCSRIQRHSLTSKIQTISEAFSFCILKVVLFLRSVLNSFFYRQLSSAALIPYFHKGIKNLL